MCIAIVRTLNEMAATAAAARKSAENLLRQNDLVRQQKKATSTVNFISKHKQAASIYARL